MTVAGKNPSLKRKIFITSEKIKVPGTEDEHKKKKKRKSQCLRVLCYKGGYRTFITGHEGMVKEEGGKRKVKEFALRVVLLVSV